MGGHNVLPGGVSVREALAFEQVSFQQEKPVSTGKLGLSLCIEVDESKYVEKTTNAILRNNGDCNQLVIGEEVFNIRGTSLGKGQFGAVDLVEDSTGKAFALKKILGSDARSQDGKTVSELDVLNRLNEKRSKYIVSVIRSGECENQIGGSLGDSFTYVLMEKADCSLKDLMGMCTLNRVMNTMMHISKAIQVLQTENFVHCDIKPDNILVFEKHSKSKPTRYTYKLGDFGATRQIGDPVVSGPGTQFYAAPEGPSTKSDIFSLGVTAYEMVTGKPFIGRDIEPVSLMDIRKESISNSLKNLQDSAMGKECPEIVELIVRMLSKEPDDRPSAMEVSVALKAIATDINLGRQESEAMANADS